MTTDINLYSAFLVGLMGGVHCIGMCGPVVGAISVGLPGNVQVNLMRSLPFVLSYNLGRISSYTFAGVLAGALGDFLEGLGSMHITRGIMQLLAGIIMILLGLYLGGWWMILTRLEKTGLYFWKLIEPVGRRVLPISNPVQAYIAGLVWGWLPCGLVYTVLIWSLTAGGMVQGGLLMLSFGLGTLPLLLVMGVAAARISSLVRHPLVRAAAGGLVSVFGLYMLVLALQVLLS
jgi:sulfite exporter TauE/SafE